MKQFECGTLVQGCEWHTRANEEAEVVHCAAEHLRMVHAETGILENIVQTVRARITETPDNKGAQAKILDEQAA